MLFFVVLQSLSHFYSLGRGRGVVLPNITSSFIFRGQQLPKLLLARKNTSANKNPNSKSWNSVFHAKNPNRLKCINNLWFYHILQSYQIRLNKQVSLSLRKPRFKVVRKEMFLTRKANLWTQAYSKLKILSVSPYFYHSGSATVVGRRMGRVKFPAYAFFFFPFLKWNYFL